MSWDEIRDSLGLDDKDKEKIEEVIHKAILHGKELDKVIVLNIDAVTVAAVGPFRFLVKAAAGDGFDIDDAAARNERFVLVLPRIEAMWDFFPESIADDLRHPPSEGATFVIIVREQEVSSLEWRPEPIPVPPKSELN